MIRNNPLLFHEMQMKSRRLQEWHVFMNLNRILRKNQQIVVYSSDSDSDVDIRHVVTRRQ